MAKLIYAAIASRDGYIEDEQGRFDWSMPDDELHAFVNDLERPIGTYLCGRRMYETMVFWETASTEADEPAMFRDYAEIWRATEKIVYSRTPQTVSSARTRIEREFDRDAVRRLKPSSGADVAIRGAELAGHAMGAVLVDECHVFLCPIVVGGGKRALQDTSARNSNSSMNAGSETASSISTTASASDRGGNPTPGKDLLERGSRPLRHCKMR